jgi:fatty-acid desaturase
MYELDLKWSIIKLAKRIGRVKTLKVLSDENQGGSKLVSIDSFFFTV